MVAAGAVGEEIGGKWEDASWTIGASSDFAEFGALVGA